MKKPTFVAAAAAVVFALVATPAAAFAVDPAPAASAASFTDGTCSAGGETTYTLTAGTDALSTTVRLKDLGDGTGGTAETYYAADGTAGAPGQIVDLASPAVASGASESFTVSGLPAGDYRWTVSGGTVTNAERRVLQQNGTITVPDCPATSSATFTDATATAGGATTYTLTAGTSDVSTTIRVKNLGDGTGGTAETFYAADGTPGAPGVPVDFATVTVPAGTSQTFSLAGVPAGDYRWTVSGGTVTNAERRVLQQDGAIAAPVVPASSSATFTDLTCDADGATTYTLTAGTSDVSTTIRVKNLGDGTGGTAETFYAADGTPGAPGVPVDFATVTVPAGTSQTFSLAGVPAGDYRWTVSGGTVTNAERRVLQQDGAIAPADCAPVDPDVAPEGGTPAGSDDSDAGLALTGATGPSLGVLFLGGGAVLAGGLLLGVRTLLVRRGH